MSSQIREVEFVRANASQPSVVLGVRYNDHDGLVAMGVDGIVTDRPDRLLALLGRGALNRSSP